MFLSFKIHQVLSSSFLSLGKICMSQIHMSEIISNPFVSKYVKKSWRTSQPQTFQPQTSILDLSTPEFSTMNFWTIKSLGLKGPGWKLEVEKSGVEMSFNRYGVLRFRKVKGRGWYWISGFPDFLGFLDSLVWGGHLISWLWVWWIFILFLDQIRTKICKSNLQGFVCNLQYAYVPLMKNVDCEEFYTKVKLKLSLVNH